MRMWRQLGFLFTASCLVASCSTSYEPSASHGGPWNAEIEQAKVQAEKQGNQLVQAILSDGEITAVELQSVEGTFDSCLKDAGFEGGGFLRRLEGGTYVSGNIAELSEYEQHIRVQNCSETSGIDLVEFAVRQHINPVNEDIVALSSRCMKARHLIEQEYTLREIEEFTTAIEALEGEDREKAAECNIDPHRYIESHNE